MYIFGASGHGKVVAEIAEENNIHIDGFIDADVSKESILNYHVQQELPQFNAQFVVAIGNNLIRKKIVEENLDLQFLNLIHPKSVISKRSQVDYGTVIMCGVSINSEVKIGRHCIINTNASIDHECLIDNFVHISPNAALAGNVSVGEGTHIGIGACVIQGVNIGKWCTIGAGSVIINDIPDGSTVVGNPGKIIKIKNISNL